MRPKFDTQGGKPLRTSVSTPAADAWAGRPAERLDVAGDLVRTAFGDPTRRIRLDVAGDLVLFLWYEGDVWRDLHFRARGATVTYDPA